MGAEIVDGRNKKKPEKKPQSRRERARDWAKVISNTHDWDWSHMLEIWIYALRRMRDNERDCGHHEMSSEDAKKMTKALDLLERVQKDEYYDNDKPFSQARYRAAERAARRDLEKALKIVSDNLFSWWD